MSPEQDEASLIRKVVNGDTQAFRTLYRRHAPALYRFSLAMTGGSEADAHDLVQETWLRATRSLGDFEGRSSLRSWLRAIASRCNAERFRRSRRDEQGIDIDRAQVAAKPAPVASRVDLERVICEMPAGFRTVLLLHDLEGYRHRDIAELLGIAPGTSKSQLSRARQWVRKALGDEYDRTG